MEILTKFVIKNQLFWKYANKKCNTPSEPDRRNYIISFLEPHFYFIYSQSDFCAFRNFNTISKVSKVPGADPLPEACFWGWGGNPPQCRVKGGKIGVCPTPPSSAKNWIKRAIFPAKSPFSEILPPPIIFPNSASAPPPQYLYSQMAT